MIFFSKCNEFMSRIDNSLRKTLSGVEELGERNGKYSTVVMNEKESRNSVRRVLPTASLFHQSKVVHLYTLCGS